MATATITPSAPASAPSAPASSPVPASTPTPAPAAPAGGAGSGPGIGTPETAPANPLGGKTMENYLADSIRGKMAEPKIDDPAPADALDVDEPEPVTEVEERAATEEEEAAPAAAPATDAEEEFDFDLDEVGTIATRDLAARLEENPDLAQALEAAGLKDQFFAATRLAAEAVELKEVFPGGVDHARIAAESHEVFSNVSDLFSNVQDWGTPEAGVSTQAVIRGLMDATALRDDEGNVILQENGLPKTTGVVGKFLSNAVKLRLSQYAGKTGQRNEFTEAVGTHLAAMREAAVKAGNEETVAAVDQLLMESKELRAPSSAKEEQPHDNPELSAREADVKRREDALREQTTQAAVKAQEAFDERVNGKIDVQLDAAVNTVLDKATGLTAFSRKALDGELRAELTKAIRGDTYYKREIRALDNSANPHSPANEIKRVAAATKALKFHLKQVAPRLLNEAGASQDEANANKATRAAARKVATQSETSSAMSIAKTFPGQLNGPEAYKTVAASLKSTIGREPEMHEVIAELAKQRMTAPKR